MLVLGCAQNVRSYPAPGGTVLNQPCPRGLKAPNGNGPTLLSPDGAPVRWLLMDAYTYTTSALLGITPPEVQSSKRSRRLAIWVLSMAQFCHRRVYPVRLNGELSRVAERDWVQASPSCLVVVS